VNRYLQYGINSSLIVKILCFCQSYQWTSNMLQCITFHHIRLTEMCHDDNFQNGADTRLKFSNWTLCHLHNWTITWTTSAPPAGRKFPSWRKGHHTSYHIIVQLHKPTQFYFYNYYGTIL